MWLLCNIYSWQTITEGNLYKVLHKHTFNWLRISETTTHRLKQFSYSLTRKYGSCINIYFDGAEKRFRAVALSLLVFFSAVPRLLNGTRLS